jgi:hypothetical protein
VPKPDHISDLERRQLALFEMLGLSLDRSCTENDFVDRLLDLLMTHGKGWETVEREGASSPD